MHIQDPKNNAYIFKWQIIVDEHQVQLLFSSVFHFSTQKKVGSTKNTTNVF